MAIPNYMKPESPKRKSIKQEKRIAKKGFVTPSSGSYWPFKGDVAMENNYLVEAKRTDAKSMSVKEEWLKKIYNDAVTINKEPGIELEFEGYYIQGVVFKK
jgi:hypothetical protein